MTDEVDAQRPAWANKRALLPVIGDRHRKSVGRDARRFRSAASLTWGRDRCSPDRYGAIPITIHWLAAILILLALGSGFQAGNAVEQAVKAGFLRIHIPAAITVLLLTAFRIIWWWVIDKKPLLMPGWQERLARGVHLAFYVVVLGMIASGIGMMVLSGAGPIIFGGSGAALPEFHLYPPRVSHGFGANLLLALLFTHVAAALYHQFVRRDGLLRRMWYRP